MRVYLVVIDESQEAHSALRFAARRAADTEGAVHLLALVPKQDSAPSAGSRRRSRKKRATAPK